MRRPWSNSWGSSLRVRLLSSTVAGLALALLLTGLALSSLFRDHVTRQFQATLMLQLDQLTAQLEFSPTGEPQVNTQALFDPRWQTPYSGLYWQIDSPGQVGVLRSRSLWDMTLALPPDKLTDGEVHVHSGTGPQNAPLLMLERRVHMADQPSPHWRLVVAADASSLDNAIARLRHVLVLSLSVLFILLVLAALAQVYVGLRPLRSLQQALANLRCGQTSRIQGRFPSEVQPLIDDFNGVLERNADIVERARTHAGNLAHAIKTPLAVLTQAAASATHTDDTFAHLVRDQVAIAQRHTDWHLARSRAAAAQHIPGQRTPLAPTIQGLVRVMQRVHAERTLHIECAPLQASWAFAGEEQDLQEILGNLLDNACKWAHTCVHISATLHAPTQASAKPWLQICIEDDGPGIDASHRATVMARGSRMDESQPGSGLGLAIVADLLRTYHGSLELDQSHLGGLRVELHLPATS